VLIFLHIPGTANSGSIATDVRAIRLESCAASTVANCRPYSSPSHVLDSILIRRRSPRNFLPAYFVRAAMAGRTRKGQAAVLSATGAENLRSAALPRPLRQRRVASSAKPPLVCLSGLSEKVPDARRPEDAPRGCYGQLGTPAWFARKLRLRPVIMFSLKRSL